MCDETKDRLFGWGADNIFSWKGGSRPNKFEKHWFKCMLQSLDSDLTIGMCHTLNKLLIMFLEVIASNYIFSRILNFVGECFVFCTYMVMLDDNLSTRVDILNLNNKKCNVISEKQFNNRLLTSSFTM